MVPQGDVNALTEALRRIKVSPLSRKACWQRVVRMYDKDKYYHQYSNLYEEMIRNEDHANTE